MSTSIEKLTEVLTLFMSPNYNVVSPTYVDLLLTHISEIGKDCKSPIYNSNY